jgi:hypothetical protein
MDVTSSSGRLPSLKCRLFFGRGLSCGNEGRPDSQHSYVFVEGFGFCFSRTLDGVRSIGGQRYIKMILPDCMKIVRSVPVSKPRIAYTLPPDSLQIQVGHGKSAAIRSTLLPQRLFYCTVWRSIFTVLYEVRLKRDRLWSKVFHPLDCFFAPASPEYIVWSKSLSGWKGEQVL